LKYGPILGGQSSEELFGKVAVRDSGLAGMDISRSRTRERPDLAFGQLTAKIFGLSFLASERINTCIYGNSSKPPGEGIFMAAAEFRHFGKCFAESDLQYFFDLFGPVQIPAGDAGNEPFVPLKDLFEGCRITRKEQIYQLPVRPFSSKARNATPGFISQAYKALVF
jgi:hypothetical protein